MQMCTHTIEDVECMMRQRNKREHKSTHLTINYNNVKCELCDRSEMKSEYEMMMSDEMR